MLYCWYCHILLYDDIVIVIYGIISYEVFEYGHHMIQLNSDHIWPYHTTGHTGRKGPASARQTLEKMQIQYRVPSSLTPNLSMDWAPFEPHAR